MSRRSLHFWASGKPMAPSNEEHLQRVLSVVRKIDRGSASANRAALLASREDGLLPLDLLVAKDYDRVGSLLGEGNARRVPLPKLSKDARAARAPRPPEERVGSLQDRIHPTSGRLRASKAISIPRRKQVPTLGPDSDEAKRVDAALGDWRQGDLALDEEWFVHVGDPSVPLTEAAAQTSDVGIQALTSEAQGLVIVTQTCDIVRRCVARPYVEVAPLVQVSEDQLHSVKRGRRLAYAALPALESRRLVADLDRVMTAERSIVAEWKRTPGYARDADGRAFALARTRIRFAFPDDFNRLVKKLQGRLTDKHEKSSPEGCALRALREIRVRAAPAWDAPQSTAKSSSSVT